MNLLSILDHEDKTSPLKNCLRNSYTHLKKWAKRTETDCFRIYDRDLHAVPISIDLYAGNFAIQYYAKGKDQLEPEEKLVNEVNQVLKTLFGITEKAIYWRTRSKSKTTRQYEKRDQQGHFFVAKEYGASFYINLTDYLDTGLFLDHRETRQLVAKEAQGKQLLNLFAYTCAFSVQAALHGASSVTSVDMSNTYIDWGFDNFRLNHLSFKNHPIIRADCLKFLPEELKSGKKYDLIIIDPPTISRSKKMEGLFDIQDDYPFLLTHALKLLTPNGSIFFSTNSRKFQLDAQALPPCKIREITEKTIPIDFRDEKIHRVWTLS